MDESDNFSYEELPDFCDYVFDNWVGEERKWPVDMRNHYENMDEPRTNNHVEGFHRKLDEIFPDKKPNIWGFISRIKKLETQYCAKWLRSSGTTRNNRSKSDIDRDRLIAICHKEYFEKKIDLAELLNKLADIAVHDYSKYCITENNDN